MLKHQAHHYDDFLRLKVSFSLWIAILYGARHFLFLGFAKLMPDDVASLPWLYAQVNQYFMLADLPAALVLLAIGHRVPDALKVMRWIWLNGKWILLSSYVIGLGLFSFLNKNLLFSGTENFVLFFSVIIPDVIFATYLFKSELISDIFKEFP